jgi:type VI protein secretion system component VasK
VEADLLKSYLNGRNGAVAEFLKAIQPFLDQARSGGLFPKVWNDRKLNFQARSLESLSRLQTLSEALFAGNAEFNRMQVQAVVDANPRATLRLRAGGKEAQAAPGESSANLSFSWPPAGEETVEISAKTANGETKLQEQGQWALLRLLWKQGRPENRNKVQLDWRVKDRSYYIPVSLSFLMESSNNPFTDQQFFRVDLGRELFNR